MKPWKFKTGPWRDAFVLTATYPDDWSDDAGRAVPHPWGTLTGGRYVYEQIGAGEGGSVDAWQFHPPVFTESAAMPAHLRGILRGFIPENYPQDPADWSGWTTQPKIQDTDPLQGSRPGMQPDLDLSKLPDKGKYFVGFFPIDTDAARGQLLYPDLLRNDPNYGTITLWANLKDADLYENKIVQMAPMLAFATVGMVFAAVDFPQLAMDSVKAAQSGNPSSALIAFMGDIATVDTFDISSVLSDTSTDVVSTMTNNDPGLLDGAIDPYANMDTSLPNIGANADTTSGLGNQQPFDPNSDFADTTFPPDQGTINDTPQFADEGGNSVNPDQEPGMPNAPGIPRQGGISNNANTRPGSSGAKAGSTPGQGSFGGILSGLANIFGTNPNHAAPGYPAGANALPNARPVVGSRSYMGPQTSGTGGIGTVAGLGSAFASPVLIAAVVVGVLAYAMTK